MSCGERRKWHFWDPQLKNFLREHAFKISSAIGALTFFLVRTLWKSHVAPFTSSIKREIGKFHVEVAQRRLRNVQKSVMHVQSCFANINLLLVCRSRCRFLSSIFCFNEAAGLEERLTRLQIHNATQCIGKFHKFCVSLSYFPIFSHGCKCNNPIFGQWRHYLAFTPRVSRLGDPVCNCSLWTMVCVCWVFAEDRWASLHFLV